MQVSYVRIWFLCKIWKKGIIFWQDFPPNFPYLPNVASEQHSPKSPKNLKLQNNYNLIYVLGPKI